MPTAMIISYFRIAFRNILKRRIFSIINIGGMTLGLACAIIIFLVVRYEFSFDTYHEDADKIYRVVREETVPREFHDAGVPYPLPDAMRTDFPELESVSIVDANMASEPVVSVINSSGSINRFKEKSAAFVGPDYFSIFTYEWISQAGKEVLNRPNTVVITRTLAQKLFGLEDPLGKPLTLQTSLAYDLEVTGVVEDPPHNSDFPFNMMISFSSVTRNGASRLNENWNSSSSAVQCYLKLESGVNPASIDSKMDDFINKYRNTQETDPTRFYLQPLSEIHSDGRFGNYRGRTVPVEMIWALGLIGLFLLIAANINFVNLNTAIASDRSKEVGIRKTFGGTRLHLTGYFLWETALIILCAFMAALALAEVAGKLLESLLGYRLEINLLTDPWLLPYLILLFALTTLAAGLYPALYLSGFNPIQAIQKKIRTRYNRGLTLRRSLVVIQFSISQTLIICTLVISSQMSYFRSADMGFDENAVVEVDLPVNDEASLHQFQNQLEMQSVIHNLTFSNTGTAHGNTWGGNYILQKEDDQIEGGVQIKFVDAEYLDTYGIDLLAGSDLAPVDTVIQYLVNEAFVRDAGFENRYHDIIGLQLNVWGRVASITGVVKNFHTNSLHRELEPVVLTALPSFYNIAGIKIDMNRSEEALGIVENAYTSAFPDYVFDYIFLDTRIDNFYKKELSISKLMNLFTIVAILIGCLGLYGLVSYMSVARQKEVGIRKVLGADSWNIVYIFLKEFFLLIGLSFMISTPVALILMNRWLEDFAYQIDIGFGLFGMAFVVTLLVVLGSVGYKCMRTASMNPVEILKNN